MLVDFQQAMADLVASPSFCRQARADRSALRARYELTQREFNRLIGVINQQGMVLNCMLYRANRLAPLVMNLSRTCTALGPQLGTLLTEYTTLHPNTNVHFYVESERFSAFLENKLREGFPLDAEAKAALAEESLIVRLNLRATQTAL